MSGLPLHRSDVASLGGIARNTLCEKDVHRRRFMRARVYVCVRDGKHFIHVRCIYSSQRVARRSRTLVLRKAAPKTCQVRA